MAAEQEWTIVIESPPGTEVDDEAFDRFVEAIRADEKAMGAAPILDNGKGILSARFQVRASTEPDAQALGIAVFSRAAATAGIESPAGAPWVVLESGRSSDWPRPAAWEN